MAKYILLTDRARVWQRRPGATGKPQIERGEGAPEPMFSVAELTASDLRDVARDLSVISAARVMQTRLIGPEPLDAFRPDDAEPGWHLAATAVSGSSATGKGQKIAVLDTGIDPNHPAFAGLSLTTCDFTGRGLRDYHGHGTHLAGIAFGADLDGVRMGIARELAGRQVGKVIHDTGHGTTDAFFLSLNWVVAEKAPIVTFALDLNPVRHVEELFQQDGTPQALAERQATRTMTTTLGMFDLFADMLGDDRRPFFAVPAGNDSRRQISPEFEVSSIGFGRSRYTTAVTAVGPGMNGLELASFANTGATLAAPGVAIVAADEGGDVRAHNGTSMAAAHVAGIAALWLSVRPAAETLPAAPWLEQVLTTHATRHGLDPALGTHDVGFGLVQAPA